MLSQYLVTKQSQDQTRADLKLYRGTHYRWQCIYPCQTHHSFWCPYHQGRHCIDAFCFPGDSTLCSHQHRTGNSDWQSQREARPEGIASCASLGTSGKTMMTVWNPCAILGEQCSDYMGYSLKLSQIGKVVFFFFFCKLFSNGWGVIQRRAPYQVHCGSPRGAVQGISSLSYTDCLQDSQSIIMSAHLLVPELILQLQTVWQ